MTSFDWTWFDLTRCGTPAGDVRRRASMASSTSAPNSARLARASTTITSVTMATSALRRAGLAWRSWLSYAAAHRLERGAAWRSVLLWWTPGGSHTHAHAHSQCVTATVQHRASRKCGVLCIHAYSRPCTPGEYRLLRRIRAKPAHCRLHTCWEHVYVRVETMICVR